MAARSVILGTAGHIDHGKTSLIRELTGIDTDRLKEEKRRGITIELGFAHLEIDDLRFGIVDVPGHERFIKSMVAGAGGIDLVMLVVAADEGVMPQTREHLDICQLLGVPRGLVALSKADLAEPDWLELVVDELRETLSGTFLADAPIVPCSAADRSGLDQLRDELARLAGEVPDRDVGGLLRLPLDRVFTIKGFGTIVTGTLVSGALGAGETVSVLPSDVNASSVRRLQVHGQDVDRAVAGQRTAVNLGGVDRKEVARGEVLVHQGTLTPSQMIDVEIQLLPGTRKPLGPRSKVLFHQGTHQQEATCVLLDGRTAEPGGSRVAQLRFEHPVVVLPQDRFILRGFVKQENYGTTIGGGRVVRVLSRKIRPKRDASAVSLLQRMLAADPAERVELEVLGYGTLGLRRDQLQRRLPLTPPVLERLLGQLLSSGALIRFDHDSGAVIHRDPFSSLSERLLQIVDRFHEAHPLQRGIGREELRSRLGPSVDARLFFTLLKQLEKDGDLAVDRELCRRPAHEVAAGSTIEPLAQRIMEIYVEAGLGPPREEELPALSDGQRSQVSTALQLLVQRGELVRLSGLYFAPGPLSKLADDLRAYLDEHETISTGEFKKLVGQSRKFCIPLAEHFDAQKLTIRVGDLRRLRK